MRPARARVYCPPGGYRERVAPAAILDIDGTLVDTNYHHAVAWYRAFRRHGIVLPVWRVHRHIGMGGDQLVAALATRGHRRLDDVGGRGADQAGAGPGR